MNDYFGQGGPYQSTPITREPELPLIWDPTWGPPIIEGVTLWSGTTDQSSRALAVRATGTYLRKGLALYKIGSTSAVAPGRFAAAGQMSGNSPAIPDPYGGNSPGADVHERIVGFLADDVDMLDKSTGVVAQQQARIVRAGYLYYPHIHDMYGNQGWILAQLKQGASKYNWTNFAFTLDIVSPGPVSP